MQALDLAIELKPSRQRRLVFALMLLLALVIAPVQAWWLKAPWPLLLVAALPLLWRLFPECEPQRLCLCGDWIEVVTESGVRSGTIEGGAAITSWALELPVRWGCGACDRVVIWRDAVGDANYRRLARTLRRLRARL